MIDLVMGAAIGYTADEIRPFLRSLRESGYEGAICLFANQGAAKEAKNWQVDIRPCPPSHGKPHAARFLWIEEALSDLECEGVLLADTRDVIFQRNPESLDASGLHAYEEDRSMTMGSCPYNSEWYRLGYGEGALKEVATLPISCVGVLHGGFTEVHNYLTRLRMEIEKIQPRTNKPQDQAAHNYLVRKVIPSQVWNNEVGDVYTVGYLPRESVVMEDGKILNAVGNIPSVIHQWDRHQNLKAFVENTYV